tara:strand:- start:709 stop:936 length:228 start_codon:yes stop_codon:yes gene_type:complete
MPTSATEPNPFEPYRDAEKVDGSGFKTRHASTSAAVMARRRRTWPMSVSSHGAREERTMRISNNLLEEINHGTFH